VLTKPKSHAADNNQTAARDRFAAERKPRPGQMSADDFITATLIKTAVDKMPEQLRT